MERQPVVALDQFSGRVPALLECARALWPFPDSANLYPGGRRLLSPDDGEAWRYVAFALRQVAPTLQRVFGARSFHCIEASFSTVSVPPAALKPPQRVPHFDAVDPNYIAILHYLTDTAGTAFFRQQSTGIERLTADNQADYRQARAAEQGGAGGYIAGSNTDYEQIGQVAGTMDRVAIYRGALLHSGIITEDPSIQAGRFPGRLTANLFVQIQSY
jgi:hypothetical protein